MKVNLPEVDVLALCHTCRLKHAYRVKPHELASAMGQWEAKHQGHLTAYGPPRPAYDRPWLKALREFWTDTFPLWAPAGYGYGHNADAKVAYASSAAYTFGLASLATSSTRTAGRESTSLSNASNKYLDVLAGGVTRTGTSPTANKQIDLSVVGSRDDTPTWPDVFDGTDSAETVTSENVRNTCCRTIASAVIDSTNARDYEFAPFSVASLYGGFLPVAHVLFLAHDTAVNLDSTSGNHVFKNTGIYGTVA